MRDVLRAIVVVSNNGLVVLSAIEKVACMWVEVIFVIRVVEKMCND